MIHPRVNLARVQTFIWEHLQISLRTFANSIGKCLENAIAFIHLVLKNILQENNADPSTFS